MGTRNLTIVVSNNKIKVAQYGQWDGYPSGQGMVCLDFLRRANLNKFKINLQKTRFLQPDGKDKKFLESYEKNAPEWSNEPDNRTEEQKEWFERWMTRNIGAKILNNILESEDEEILLDNKIDFSKDSLFCEWAYVIDLDKNTFEVYKGFIKSPLDENERFYSKEPNSGGYYPIKLLKSYSLDDLPDNDEFEKLGNSED